MFILPATARQHDFRLIASFRCASLLPSVHVGTTRRSSYYIEMVRRRWYQNRRTVPPPTNSTPRLPERKRGDELTGGLEPPACALQVRCSTS